MTSDAKIGLLLGLVFIFIIAFIINGLPSFQKNVNTNNLTTSMANSHANPPGIAAKERKLQEIFEQTKPIKTQLPEIKAASSVENKIRSVMPLPNNPANTDTIAKAQPPKSVEAQTQTPAVPKTPVVITKVEKSKPVKKIRPKVRMYVVSEGDNLATIAIKFYGEEEGNRRTNIARIFETNRRLLNSPDELYVGQKLIIPPLPKTRIEREYSAKPHRKTESTRQKYLAASSRRTTSGKWYVVKEDDSLWKIADKQLNDATRYAEILRLNDDILDDEDELSIGMRLKMPAK